MIHFSVIVPIYNAEKYIARCVHSICGQNDPDLEIILINDGSTDGTDALCRQLCAEDPRIVYRVQDNQGPSIARQNGLAYATGEYILFVDADDFLAPGLVDCVRPYCEQGMDIVEFGYILEWDGRRECHPLRPERKEGRECLAHYIHQKNVTNYLCNKVFRRELFQGVEFPKLYLSEDQCILAQLYYHAASICTVEEAFYHYYSNPASLCNSPFTPRTMDVLKANAYIYNFLLEKEMPFAAVQAIMGVNAAILVYNKLDLTYFEADRADYRKRIMADYRKWRRICAEHKLFGRLSLKQKLKWMLFRLSPHMTSLLRKRMG